MEQVYTPTKDYKVLVRCMTYNQSKYIEDALNGFVMQKTDFPFVCLVMDDASTDGEQEVIKAWMERECDMSQVENMEIEKSFIMLVPHKTNVNCTFAFFFLKENLYGTGKKLPLIAPWREHCEYEALCEGDDWWIDKDKLQKQVIFLDLHQEYSASATNSEIVDQNGTFLRLFSKKETRIICTLGEIVPSRQFHTATVVFRTNSLKKSVYYKYYNTWDTFMWSCLVSVAPIYYSKEVTSTYRKGSGVTSTTQKYYWCLQVEEWSNVLMKFFYPGMLSWTDAYSGLMRDITYAMINCNITKEEKAQLKIKRKKYNTFKIWCFNAKSYARMYMSKFIRTLLSSR